MGWGDESRSGFHSPLAGKGGAEITFEISGDAAIAQMFEELPKHVQERVLKPLLRDASATVASVAESDAPEQLGLLKQAVGASALRVYGSRLFITVGVRQGFGRDVQVSARRAGRLTGRPGRGLVPQSTRVDPARYGGTVQAGRGPIEAAGTKILYSRVLDLVLGRRVAAAKPRPFMREAFDQTAQAVISKIQADAAPRIEAEAAALAAR